MSDGYNKIQLLGNLGADAELRSTSGGQAVLKFRVACSESYVDRDKQRKERTEWINCVLWGKRAEALSKFLIKGARVFIEGSLHTSSYEGKDGQKRYSTDVTVRELILCGGGRERSDSHTQSAGDDIAPRGSGDDEFPF